MGSDADRGVFAGVRVESEHFGPSNVTLGDGGLELFARKGCMAFENGVSCRQFVGRQGVCETFFSFEPSGETSFQDQLDSVQAKCRRLLAKMQIPTESAIFRRIFISDAINQLPLVCAHPIAANNASSPVAVSIIQQPPAGGPKVTMLAYHITSQRPLAKQRLSTGHLVVEHNGIKHLWSTRLCAGATDNCTDTGTQTKDIFDNLVQTLTSLGGTIKDNCVRTWIYLKDVDVFYDDMVKARRNLFELEGLRADAHYIASTGIEGACGHRFDLVSLDAYSVLNLRNDQVTYLNDFARLCPTKNYGVTFERATRVAFADRAQIFISGTASIDAAGQVVHHGDVLKQLEYALKNVEALLRAGNSDFNNMMYLLVYLRDPVDYTLVDRYLAHRFPNLPVIIVQGAVCRPEWLIEVEGQAIAPLDEKSLPEF
jgi:enamine deaminase RidA (YjgF/YER057c/UK114 family)